MHKKILLQLCIILILCLCSEVIVSFLPFAFPASVTAILILALLLGMRILKEEQIAETADFMLSNMALVFVPVTVGIAEDLDLLKGKLILFLLIVIVTLILTFLGTYLAVRVVQKIFGTDRSKEQDLNQ